MIDIPEGAWPLIWLVAAGLAVFTLMLMIVLYEMALEAKEFFKHANETRSGHRRS